MTQWAGLSTIVMVALVIAILGGLSFVRFRGYVRADPGDTGGTAFDSAGYEAMSRLTDRSDLEFLRRQGECGRELSKQWKRSRRRVLRMYLNDVGADFRALHAQARLLVAEAPAQDSDLAEALMRQQWVFWRTMARIEVKLLLSRMGIGEVDLRPLVEQIEAMRITIARSSASVPA
jgi:hypothetical protein